MASEIDFHRKRGKVLLKVVSLKGSHDTNDESSSDSQLVSQSFALDENKCSWFLTIGYQVKDMGEFDVLKLTK